MGFLNKLLNLKSANKSNISMSTALLIFYMMVATVFTGNLYSGQLSEYIKTNRWMQHVVGYITMLLIVSKVAGIKDGYMSLLYSLIAYSWFILTTKLDVHWNLAIIGLLVIGFIYENNMFQKEDDANTDEALDEKDRKRIRHDNKQMKRIIILSIVGITAVGSFLYFNKKQVQYGGNFDISKFMFCESKGHKC